MGIQPVPLFSFNIFESKDLMKQVFSFLFAVAALAQLANAEDTRCYELRIYHTNPGKLDALHARFRDHTMKIFEKHGIKNVGYWVPQTNGENSADGNRLIYVVSYPSKEARGAAWKGFLGDADWKKAYKASTTDGKLVKKIDSVLMKATDYSPAIKAAKADDSRLFELRTYTTREGRLDALNSRFRDHTAALFKKHKLSQFAYWTPMEEKDGRDTKLIYVLAHKDEESRDAGFSAFGKDPAWQEARKASEADGPILVKKGVKREYMTPTDYSPTK